MQPALTHQHSIVQFSLYSLVSSVTCHKALICNAWAWHVLTKIFVCPLSSCYQPLQDSSSRQNAQIGRNQIKLTRTDTGEGAVTPTILFKSRRSEVLETCFMFNSCFSDLILFAWVHGFVLVLIKFFEDKRLDHSSASRTVFIALIWVKTQLDNPSRQKVV